MGNDLTKRFKEVDTSDFPSFNIYKKPLEIGLWVLWVAKDKLQIKMLSARQIASVIRDVKEISINAESITRAFNRAGDKIHTYHQNEEVYYEIMIPGKEHLATQLKDESINVYYFKPEKEYTSKRVLVKNILSNLKGELKIVDPYCGERTLDILTNVKNDVVKFITNLENLRRKNKGGFLRELEDFKKENPNIEFRNYPHTDIHDRYIISSDNLVILGHSIKDLGTRETFAIILNKDTNKDIFEALVENFSRRWIQSTQL